MTDKERVEKEANEFIEWCHRNDIRWTNNDNDTIKTYFYVNKENTCYNFDVVLGRLFYSSKKFYKNNGFIVMTFKEFMNKPITNLEYILNNFNKETINETDCICGTLIKSLGMPDCCGMHCRDCKFDSQYEVLKALNDIHKENNISLTKVQYEILKCLPQNLSITISGNELIVHEDNLEMFMNKLGVKIIYSDHHEEKSIKIKDILEKCEVVE